MHTLVLINSNEITNAILSINTQKSGTPMWSTANNSILVNFVIRAEE